MLRHPLAVLARIADERVVLSTTFGDTRHQEFEREAPGGQAGMSSRTR
jgi:hypothetical protein